MKYMLLIYIDEKGSPNEAERQQCYVESAEYAQKLHASGKFIATAPLHPSSTATTVRHQEGKPLITDGPFAETREQLGGYFLVNATDLDEAIRIASEIPAGRWGTVEIRPVLEVAGIPNAVSAA